MSRGQKGVGEHLQCANMHCKFLGRDSIKICLLSNLVETLFRIRQCLEAVCGEDKTEMKAMCWIHTTASMSGARADIANQSQHTFSTDHGVSLTNFPQHHPSDLYYQVNGIDIVMRPVCHARVKCSG